VRSNVSLAQASSEETVLPERVQEALRQLVGAAKEGLLALRPSRRRALSWIRGPGGVLALSAAAAFLAGRRPDFGGTGRAPAQLFAADASGMVKFDVRCAGGRQ